MTQGEIAMRQLVNEYFNKPKEQTKIQFCKERKIKCYQLNRMIELYGQKFVPVTMLNQYGLPELH